MIKCLDKWSTATEHRSPAPTNARRKYQRPNGALLHRLIPRIAEGGPW